MMAYFSSKKLCLRPVSGITYILLIASIACVAKPSMAAECGFDTVQPTVVTTVHKQLEGTQFDDWSYTVQPERFTPCVSGQPKVEFIVTLPVHSNLGITYEQVMNGHMVDATIASDFENELQAINLVDAQLLVDKAESNPAVIAYENYFTDVQAEVDVTWTNGIYTHVYKKNAPIEDAFNGKITYEHSAHVRKDRYPLYFQIETRHDDGIAKRLVSYPDALQRTGLFGADPLTKALNVAFTTTAQEESLLKSWKNIIKWAPVFFVVSIGCITFIIMFRIKRRQKKNIV